MAAKIGAALLEKKQLLEGKLAILESKLTSVEAKIEEMSTEEESYLRKIENLQKISELETFEEHDRKQEEIINKLVLKNRELEKSLLLKRREGHCRASSQEYVDTETQTTPTPDQTPTNAPHTGTLFSSSALLLDIAQLKNRQKQLELLVKECTGEILDQSQAAT
ncbi:hypothetical protein J6590_025362 [Homalodisca vitripennis]|nr:hypothetical protein J6590_025362 [Homalodisca vitripennis]